MGLHPVPSSVSDQTPTGKHAGLTTQLSRVYHWRTRQPDRNQPLQSQVIRCSHSTLLLASGWHEAELDAQQAYLGPGYQIVLICLKIIAFQIVVTCASKPGLLL